MFLAQAAEEGTQAPGGLAGTLPMLVFFALIFIVFYFLIMRPQKKKEQERKAMLDKLQKGDRVITIGGIYGEVTAVKENYVLIQVDKERGTTLKFGRSAIHNVITGESAEQEDK